MRTDAMLTSSIVLLMIVNTLAASAAPFVALLASALDTGDRAATTDVEGPARNTDSLRTKTMESPMHKTGVQPKERFLWLSVRRPAGQSATTMTSPTANFYGG